jgi:putative membrane protein
MGIGWLVFLGFLVTMAILIMRHLAERGQSARSAHEILAERFARGEIDEDEYRMRRDVLS